MHIIKNVDQHMFQISMSNDENNALNRNINPDNDSIAFTSSEIKIIDQNSKTTTINYEMSHY